LIKGTYRDHNQPRINWSFEASRYSTMVSIFLINII